MIQTNVSKVGRNQLTFLFFLPVLILSPSEYVCIGKYYIYTKSSESHVSLVSQQLYFTSTLGGLPRLNVSDN